jgi:ribonuclease BN (tRNA processing enzyme)
MDFKVLGCHGGESPKHQCPAFLVDGRVCLDAGSITNMLELEEQKKIEAVIVTHAHLDHVRDLAMLVDTRTQQGGPALTIAAPAQTIRVLREHFFNDALWPDFSKIPDGANPTIVFQELGFNRVEAVAGYEVRPIRVHHTVEAAAYIINDGRSALAYSGDTGPTDELWAELHATPKLKALVMEVAFPNEQRKLAHDSGHHTPESLAQELLKLGPEHRDLPTLLFHIKPVFQRVVERELAKIQARNNTILHIGDEYVL